MTRQEKYTNFLANLRSIHGGLDAEKIKQARETFDLMEPVDVILNPTIDKFRALANCQDHYWKARLEIGGESCK